MIKLIRKGLLALDDFIDRFDPEEETVYDIPIEGISPLGSSPPDEQLRKANAACEGLRKERTKLQQVVTQLKVENRLLQKRPQQWELDALKRQRDEARANAKSDREKLLFWRK